MKKVYTSAIAMFSAGSAMAGSVTFTPPVATILEEPQRMGGSGAWLIPLVILAVIALAVTKKSTTDTIVTPPPTRF